LSEVLILIFDNIFLLLLLLLLSTSIEIIADCLFFAVELELLLEIKIYCSDTNILKSIQNITLLFSKKILEISEKINIC